MKKILLLAVLSLALANVHAQAKKAPPAKNAPAKATPISAADRDKANKMITYTNSLQDFLSQYISIKTISLPLNTYEEDLQSDNPYINPATLEENFKTVGEAVKAYKADKGSNPAEPPAVVGADNQSFIKARIAACSELYEKIRSQNNSLKPLAGTESVDKNNLPAVKKLVGQMFETLDKIYGEQEALYDRIDEIGMQAEAITLSNHPMKTEILDMKNSMNKCSKVFKLFAQKTPKDAAEKLQEIKSIETQALLVRDKYGDAYSANGSGRNNSLELRSIVKDFFEKLGLYYWHVDELAKLLQSTQMDAEEWDTQVKMQKDNYQAVVTDYNAFVSANNGE